MDRLVVLRRCCFRIFTMASVATALFASRVAVAQPAATAPAITVDSVNAKADAAALAGHNAWMLTCSALVLFMTAPGLAMFYGGLVRKKNVLSVMMQCLFLMALDDRDCGHCMVTRSRSAHPATRPLNPYIGNGDYLFMKGVARTWDAATNCADRCRCTAAARSQIPRLTHMLFQGMFFIITPALICGAFAERMKFSAMVVFIDPVGNDRLLPALPLGVGRRHSVATSLGRRCDAAGRRCARFRRRHGGAYQLRRVGACLCAVDRQARGLRARGHAAAQSHVHGARRWHVVGRLVRLQRRQRAGVGYIWPRAPSAQRISRPPRVAWPGPFTTGSRAASRPCWAPPRASWPAWFASRRRLGS